MELIEAYLLFPPMSADVNRCSKTGGFFAPIRNADSFSSYRQPPHLAGQHHNPFSSSESVVSRAEADLTEGAQPWPACTPFQVRNMHLVDAGLLGKVDLTPVPGAT